MAKIVSKLLAISLRKGSSFHLSILPLFPNIVLRELFIGFDPTHTPKSGKKTEGGGKFWSGYAGAPKWGLEVSGIAAIDLDSHTAMHLEAIQTLPEEGETLLESYAKALIDRKNELQKISKVVVADAYFSKETFVTLLCLVGFHLVSRLRDDARMTYTY